MAKAADRDGPLDHSGRALTYERTFDLPRVIWMRDPQPEAGLLPRCERTVGAVVRWSGYDPGRRYARADHP